MIKKNKVLIGVIAVALCAGLYLNVKSGQTELKDGVYKVSADSYVENGYKPFVILEVKNGRMIDALLDYVNAEGELLTKNKELKHEYYDEIGNFPEAFTKEIRAELLIKQGTDTLSKATTSEKAVNTFKKMIDELLSQRVKKGKEEALTVKL